METNEQTPEEHIMAEIKKLLDLSTDMQREAGEDAAACRQTRNRYGMFGVWSLFLGAVCEMRWPKWARYRAAMIPGTIFELLAARAENYRSRADTGVVAWAIYVDQVRDLQAIANSDPQPVYPLADYLHFMKRRHGDLVARFDLSPYHHQ